MKNKHLLLLFSCTLLLGILAKYSPWFKSKIFQTELVSIDSRNIERIAITQARYAELLLERSDEGWVVSQEDLAIITADSLVIPLLTALTAIRSRRIVQSTHRDSLGLLPAQALHIEVFLKKGIIERFNIGRELVENGEPVTFIEIDGHDGIYLADKHLRSIFAKQINHFRKKTVFDFIPQHVESVQICRPNADTLYFHKKDTTHIWNQGNLTAVVPPGQVQAWEMYLGQLQELPFASAAEERLSIDRCVATINMDSQDFGETISLKFFAMGPIKPYPFSKTPVYLLQSSQNPFAFFALTDSTLVHKILAGPIIAND